MVLQHNAEGASHPSLELSIHDSFDSLESVAEEWNGFVLEETNSIYLTFDWCRVWWEFYGRNRRLAVLIFRSEGRIVGILPFGIDKVFIGWGFLRIAKLLNSEYTACVLHPAILDENLEEIFNSVIGAMFGKNVCDLLSFGQIVEESESVAALRNAALSRGQKLTVWGDRSAAVHCYFELPRTFEEYLKSLSSKQRANLRRRQRMIEEQYGPLRSIDFNHWEDIQREFSSFREMHDRYWESQGQGGHFVDLVDGEAFTLDLVRKLSEEGGVCLKRIDAGDRPIGYQFLLFFGKTVHWRLTAREIGEEWSKLGIGVQALHLLIEDSISQGFQVIEAGPGIYEYKTQMGGKYLEMRTVSIGPRTAICRIKVVSLSIVYKLLDVFYYKVRYQRLVKALGLSRRAIWNYYLRCRL